MNEMIMMTPTGGGGRHISNMKESRHTCDCVASHMRMSEFTHMKAWGHKYEWDDCGDSDSLGASYIPYLKTYVSFAKEPYKRDYILQKRPHIWMREVTNMNEMTVMALIILG